MFVLKMKGQSQNIATSLTKPLNLQLHLLNILSYFFLFGCGLTIGVILTSFRNNSTLNLNVTQLPLPREPPAQRTRLEDFLKVPEIDHDLDDEELLWRASMAPGRTKYPFHRVPKVAFLFLTKGPILMAPLWEEFFRGHLGLYSVYVHSDPSYNGSDPETPAFHGRRIPSKVPHSHRDWIRSWTHVFRKFHTTSPTETSPQRAPPKPSPLKTSHLLSSPGKKLCYVVPTVQSARYLVRTTYFYGRVNDERFPSPPVFDQVVDGTLWTVVNTTADYRNGVALEESPASGKASRRWEGTILWNSLEVKWGNVNMIEAERRLLANALLDISNERFVLLSESCIPLFNFSKVYSYLLNSTQTHVESYYLRGPVGLGRYSPQMGPSISIHQWRKGSQWFELDRALAHQVVSDQRYFPVFQQYCKGSCYADEHYLPTFVNIKVGSKNSNRTLTWVDWSKGGPHPARFIRNEVTVEFLEKLRSGNSCLYNGKNTTTCYLFARKFLPHALDRLLRFAPKVMQFNK